MRVYLGSDHAGFEVKGKLVEYLTEQGHEVIDVGAPTYDALDDYPAWCIETARRVVGDPGALGIVLGGSGNGEQIAANKVQGIRAALAWNEDTARLARQHNDAQIIGVGARQHPFTEVAAIVEAFLATPFSGDERHQRRIDQMLGYERSGEIELPS
ncbi:MULTISPECIES: ribose-5-phosphate isomerase [Pseudonocardia]|uniref:Ribose-5-phosphate isomerase B n=2 Tax=Pseudonocardia TaxID=1847 RepID=A0A1Y2N8C6_PSEAH|nr:MULTISPECIES: ribose-5-phosphate isomerase [Pseudonocardia]OSY43706.1 Ribose-5-phosphate isomerase B [Pseudonocardia autotrophica]TDN73305.1 ribose 5-phosphate isomerase B [Pseudonocardia autotrophica]BBG04041.1 ribose-5-phosphate isomerase [Pseudonocardia autotrophica]GEC29398.1 ribose-5-phosphate isomerase [Pseudonocardia saturnea]